MKNILKQNKELFFQTDGNDEHLLLRKCQFSDGAEPSGNAIHCENLLRLHQITLNKTYLEQAEDIFKGVKDFFDNYPPAYTYHVMNLDRYYDKNAPTFVVALNSKEDNLKEIQSAVYSHFIPHKAFILKRQGDRVLLDLIPALDSYINLNGQTTLYICTQGVCQKPLTDLSEMLTAIHKQ